jgi:hypothetical protein
LKIEEDVQVAEALDRTAKCALRDFASADDAAQQLYLEMFRSEFAKFRSETAVDFLICPIKWWLYNSLTAHQEDYPLVNKVSRR